MNSSVFSTLIFTLTLSLSCCENKYPDLGNGFRLITDGEYNSIIVNGNNSLQVTAHILTYAFDSTFIIAVQKPWDLPNIPNLGKMTYKQRNKVFDNSKIKYFWIINKKEQGKFSFDSIAMFGKYSNVYGPFDRKSYIYMRKKLGVPIGLNLKEE